MIKKAEHERLTALLISWANEILVRGNPVRLVDYLTGQVEKPTERKFDAAVRMFFSGLAVKLLDAFELKEKKK